MNVSTRFARTSSSSERRKHQQVCIALLTRGKDDHIRCAIDTASARNSHEFDRLLLLYLAVVNSKQGSIRCQLREIYIWRLDPRLGFRRGLIIILTFLKCVAQGATGHAVYQPCLIDVSSSVEEISPSRIDAPPFLDPDHL